MSQESTEDFVVAAVTWFTNTPPHFVTRGFTLPYVKENLLATVVVNNVSPIKTINAACHRTIEKLLTQSWIAPGNEMEITLLVKPVLSKQRFIMPSKKTKTHWLFNAAETVLTTWLRGER